MTRFCLRSSRVAGPARPEAPGGKWGLFVAILLTSAAPGCLPSLGNKPPAEVGAEGAPSELEILRADNAELSRRVHELRAEKVELKRRLALLELEDAEEPQEAAAPPSQASALPVVAIEADEMSGAPSRPVDQPGQKSRASAEAPMLISGAADAADFDLGRAALEAGSFQNADVTLSRFLAQNPRHPFADDALVLRGRARAGRHHFDAAERDFRLVAERYPEELVAPDAWLELVRLLQDRGDDPGARQASQALLARYPDSAAAALVPQEFVE